ncbi:hypothetical protein [Haloactinopolyspora sp.]|uniref:hypothetical protein n=1 Tax=Haloactinopolyspora sp. TaxID=1966353 RepID=UPI002603325D|nr:hypothetical protein [Haloactinopolyspora sp.]
MSEPRDVDQPADHGCGGTCFFCREGDPDGPTSPRRPQPPVEPIEDDDEDDER